MEKRNRDGLTEKDFLTAYKPGDYERPSVTVDMLLLAIDKHLQTLKVLLIKRGNHPFIDCWALAGGFVDIDESAYQAACRELEEETGLTNVYMEQLYTFSQPNRDPRMRVISVAYIALMQETKVKAGDDAKDALWFDVSFNDDSLIIKNDERGIKIKYKLEKKVFQNGIEKYTNYVPSLESSEALAFDHVEILLEGLQRMRSKVEYTDIAFNLIPSEFALPDLQKVYELLLGKTIYKKNFRDKISSKIISLDKKGKSIVGNKMAQLYKYNDNSELK